MKHLVLIALISLNTGCVVSRTLTAVNDGPSTGVRTTNVETIDSKRYLLTKIAVNRQVFWECEEQADGLHCEKKCDVKNEDDERIACPMFVTATK